jgi:Ser/Thr protein kinase RdoA (MazF antagonist)
MDIISERWNTVVRLGNSDVIAKSATLAHLSRIDPLHWFEQEVRVSNELAAAGAPVQMPWNGLQSCHVSNGMPVTLWQRIDGEMAGSSEIEMVDSLAELHHRGAGIELDQPWFATITVEIPGTFDMLANRGVLDQNHTRILSDHLSRLLDAIDSANLPSGFVHGDAQRKNSMHTPHGPVWIDLEETCRGPFAWDLACLTMNPRFDSERVLDRYAQVSGTNRASVQHLDVLKQLRELEGLVWMMAIRHEREAAFRQESDAQLARVLTSATAG